MKIHIARIIVIILLGNGLLVCADSIQPNIESTNHVEPVEEAVLLTPPPPSEPRINGPKVYGVRPESPFLYRIPCTGKRPMVFGAQDLPPGLMLDSQSGIITGKIEKAGTYQVELSATNSAGQARRELRIEAGNRLALTPPMGWNSWYIYARQVTQAAMCQATDKMIASGMADFGYQYVNCDDCWSVSPGSTDPELAGASRGVDDQLQPNGHFPDIKGMVDYIHARGLKAGIYSSPGPTTCAGYEGSWGHAARDASTFAAWGFDFLKYDWCSYERQADGHTLEDLQRPYLEMWDELQKQNRDIVFNLCQYGRGEVWKWGGGMGNCWRTTGDLGNARDKQLPGFYSIGMANARHWQYAHPGGWNDPDYILIGWIGADRGRSSHPTTLTPNEQYSYMSMWSLMAAPLVFSGDMTKLDPFTLNVLCNAEVIAVDQDSLGRQAKILRQTPEEYILVKDLEDGSKAVGLFNFSPFLRAMSVSWKELGLKQGQAVRDLWRQKEIGSFNGDFAANVPRHGIVLVRMAPEKPASLPR